MILLLIIMAVLTLPAQANVTCYLQGNSAGINPSLARPALDIGGGSLDVDSAIQWLINQVRGCSNCSTKVDVVVIRSASGSGYNEPIYAMKGKG